LSVTTNILATEHSLILVDEAASEYSFPDCSVGIETPSWWKGSYFRQGGILAVLQMPLEL